MKYILMDIEGTTTSISFVHDVLFPFAKSKLTNYVNLHNELDHVKNVLAETKKTVLLETNQNIDDQKAIAQLISWIEEDRKHHALKEIQGFIWSEGYKSGELKGHVYPEVPMMLKKWNDSGITLGIYSSGSIAAQKVLFGYSICGDLNGNISHNFDTTIGNKREISSYQNITKAIGLNPESILFLSDISEELDAAKAAGLKTIQLVRLEEVAFTGHSQVKSFSDIVF
jgi:enolase-phosphatase E1